MINRAHAIVLASIIAFNAFAQTPIAPADRRRLSETLPVLLESLYVLPETGKELAQRVRNSFESGKYDSATTAAALAEAINTDFAFANDRHLRMLYNAAAASMPALTVD